MKKILVLGVILSLITVTSLAGTTSVGASTAGDAISGGASKVSSDDQKENKDVADMAGTIVDVLLYIIGAVAVIMIIVGGIMYVVSGGEASAVKNAKNTILYAVIGLVVAVFAYAIVRFVFTQIDNSASSITARAQQTYDVRKPIYESALAKKKSADKLVENLTTKSKTVGSDVKQAQDTYDSLKKTKGAEHADTVKAKKTLDTLTSQKATIAKDLQSAKSAQKTADDEYKAATKRYKEAEDELTKAKAAQKKGK